MNPTHLTLKLYSFLLKFERWHLVEELVTETGLTRSDIKYALEQLNDAALEPKLVYRVRFDKKVYWFAPTPVIGGSRGALATKIRELSKDGKEEVSFEKLGRDTGYGPNTLKELINQIKRRPSVGPFKRLEFEIDNPNYKTDEPKVKPGSV